MVDLEQYNGKCFVDREESMVYKVEINRSTCVFDIIEIYNDYVSRYMDTVSLSEEEYLKTYFPDTNPDVKEIDESMYFDVINKAKELIEKQNNLKTEVDDFMKYVRFRI